MSEDHEIEIIDSLEHVAKLGKPITALIRGAFAIGTIVVGVTVWVVFINSSVQGHSRVIDVSSERVRKLEDWKTVHETSPTVSVDSFHTLDKRVQRIEDQLSTILETLKRIEAMR
jgi:hypothetical protein